MSCCLANVQTGKPCIGAVLWTIIMDNKNEQTRAGFIYAFSAYFLWGALLPPFIKLTEHMSAVEVVAHRALWSLPIAGILLVILGRTKDIIPTLKDPKKMGILFITSAIVSLNWAIYVWAIFVDRTIESALGYYINPLISVALGAIFLGDRFTKPQLIALALATSAVVLLTVQSGTLPWVSLSLAISFAIYGFLRKTVDVGPTQGFLIEVLILSVIAIPVIIWLQVSGEGHMFDGTSNTALLIACGPATAVPLILYAFGAKRLRLSTLGLMQYIAPTLIFMNGLFVFNEPFSKWQFAAFSLIWIALAIYSWSAIKQSKNG